MEPTQTTDLLPSAGLPTSSLSRTRTESNSDVLTGQQTAPNPLPSSKDRFIFNPVTSQLHNTTNKPRNEQETNPLNKSIEKTTSRFTNLTKMLPKRPPSPTMNSQSTDPPRSPPPPPVPVSNPPNMFTSTASAKRSSLSGVMNFPALERLLANKKPDSNQKPPSNPPSPSLSPSNANLHSSVLQTELSDEIHSEMETLLEVFYQERNSILQELSLVKGLWLTDRKIAQQSMEEHTKRVSNSLKRYDSLVVEIMRQFNTVSNEISQLKDSQKKFQSDMRRRMETLQSEFAENKFRDPLDRREILMDPLQSSSRKESCESINIPPASNSKDKNLGRTTSFDSNIHKYIGNKTKIGKKLPQSNLAPDEGTEFPQTPTEKSVPPSGKSKVKDTVNKKKIEKFFGEVPPHIENLSSFLTRLGYERYLVNFEKEEITLSALFHMSEEHLIYLNIPMGPRLIILREAYELAKVFKHHNINI